MMKVNKINSAVAHILPAKCKLLQENRGISYKQKRGNIWYSPI